MSTGSLFCLTLVPGEQVTVGRKPSSDLTINRPYLSGRHCVLDVRACPVGRYSCGLTDHSQNGTWILLASESGRTTNVMKTAVRVEKNVRQELSVSDQVWLLSPCHKHCMELRFVVEGGAGEGGFTLRQLPPTERPPRRKRAAGDSSSMPSTKSRRLDDEGGVVSTARTTVNTSDSPHPRVSSAHNTHTSTPSLTVEKVEGTADGLSTHSTAPSHGGLEASATICPHSSTPSPVHKAHPHSSTPSPVHKAHPHSSTPSPVHAECDIETTELEHCPHCLELFPLDQLPSHSDLCPMPRPHKHTSLEQCPVCREMFPVLDLVTHVDSCCGGRKEEEDVEYSAPDPEGDPVRRYLLEPYEGGGRGSPAHPIVGGACSTEDCRTDGPATAHSSTKESAHCLKVLPKSELKGHTCSPAAAEAGSETCSGEQEHCQHCLEVFPLSELVAHSLSCPHRRDLGSLESDGCVGGDEDMWGEPVERCMHCFRDFPLSRLVGHSRKCEGDMLGPRGRFTTFLPSVHDMDPMALSVLNETQMAAVEYVMKRSKDESEHVYSDLKSKVLALGYTEKDLETTLQWVRRDAPIIVHINLDRVLRFLTEDTHYRNLFETGTGSGSLDRSARSSWEDRIFNRLYSSSPPSERVKYGVLNIVGDPRGVQSCYHYGDSFLQLKKVRLRTTFASTDTSAHSVLLSCCEHYGNVLNQYTYPELQAILEVATRKQPFLRSTVISQYKEVQIHGPLCLSENVDCIVVNDRHASDTPTRELLDKFVECNNCNLLWMEPEERVGYPSFTPSHIPTPTMPLTSPFTHSHTPTPSAPYSAGHRTRRRRRRRRHRDDEY